MEIYTEVKEIERSNEEIIPKRSEFHIAQSVEDQIGRLEVVTERYNNENYLQNIPIVKIDDNIMDEELLSKNGYRILEENFTEDENKQFLKNGTLIDHNGKRLYFDKYHWNSVPFVTKVGDTYTGSARLIIKNGIGLPTLSDPKIEISNLWKPIVSSSVAEFSQFAIRRGSKGETSVQILKLAYDYSKRNNIDSWVATTDNSVIRLLNSSFFKFDIPNIGPSVDYLGSISTPIYINLEKSLDNAENFDSSRKIANFIRGKSNSL